MSIWLGLALSFISDAAADVHQAHKEITLHREREYFIPSVSRVEPWWLELGENHGVPGGSIINVDTRGVWLVSTMCFTVSESLEFLTFCKVSLNERASSITFCM